MATILGWARLSPMAYFEHRKLTPRKNRKRIPLGAWWVGKSEGETTLFLSCDVCHQVMALDVTYCVHPLGYLWPCVQCVKCGIEGYRFLREWTLVEELTGSEDWQDPERRIPSELPRVFRRYANLNYDEVSRPSRRVRR